MIFIHGRVTGFRVQAFPNGRRDHQGDLWEAICRQRPGTAKGFVFISLENETGIANAIVSPALFEEMRLVITQENFLKITGIAQTREGIPMVRAATIERLETTPMETAKSHDFH